MTFSGVLPRKKGRKVLFITEKRCVFRLDRDGLTLIEIAPGIYPKEDILDCMDFHPQIAPDLKIMDPRISAEEPMGIHYEILLRGKKG